ncbi:hypothetical protein PGH12_10425 [Chryseobacterium wangxinyae]|uniref:DUF6705 family protein n=1 Tax=Chryseobacterium sp. CY350 TaxID=2997336 RepID=UPI00226D7AEF|nr:DUF6705 family protein [Chryseobacterium sp. CY350]WBZ93891.1 hypothetical protein PGH12_10425 [Chryseobacterium sp. CY350]
MKKHILLQLFMFLAIACKAQTYPLDSDYKIVPNYSYLKDISNALLPFVGDWKANYNGNEIVLKIDKVDHHLNNFDVKKYYQDVLFIRYIIKNSQGNVVESTMNFNITDSNIISDMTFSNENMVSFTYTGGQCTVGWGEINLQLTDTTHFIWNYQPESTAVTNKNCSNYPTGGIKINLPYESADLIFTKQ